MSWSWPTAVDGGAAVSGDLAVSSHLLGRFRPGSLVPGTGGRAVAGLFSVPAVGQSEGFVRPGTARSLRLDTAEDPGMGRQDGRGSCSRNGRRALGPHIATSWPVAIPMDPRLRRNTPAACVNAGDASEQEDESSRTSPARRTLHAIVLPRWADLTCIAEDHRIPYMKGRRRCYLARDRPERSRPGGSVTSC